MRVIYLPFYFLLILSSCISQGQNADNTKPMYGESEKTASQKEADIEFRKICLEQFETIDSSIIVHLDLAWRYYYHNQLETAMKRFNQVWLLNSDYPDSYFGFAALLESQGSPEKANRFYEIGKEKDSLNLREEICYQSIAECKEQLNDINGTVEAYEHISRINSSNSFSLKKIGYFQMELGNLEKAKKAYSKAIELDPKDAMTFNNRGYLNQTLRKYQLAIDDYSEAIKLNPKFIGAFVNRGRTYIEKGNYEKATLDFEKCVILDPKVGELRRLLALSQIGMNEKSEACKNLEIAIRLGDDVAKQMKEENCEK